MDRVFFWNRHSDPGLVIGSICPAWKGGVANLRFESNRWKMNMQKLKHGSIDLSTLVGFP